MTKIAVYGGSFNPLHIGHLAILKYLIGKGGFDSVYLIVSPKNPLKEGVSSASAQERLAAARKAVARHFPSSQMSDCRNDMPLKAMVYVDDIEMAMPEPHYTIRTLDALKRREPDNEFTFILGSDNLADIRRWKDYGRILTEFGVMVYPRHGHDTSAIKENLLNENPDYKIDLIDADLIDISSTTIREGLAEGKDMSEWMM